jgi:hypothetical protein
VKTSRVAKAASFAPFVGQHCETVTTGTLLNSCGVRLSEPMLFGLGEGLGFVMLNLASLPLPFIGGRSRPFALTAALCRNLGLGCTARETSSKAAAWKTLAAALDARRPVGLQLDCYHLPYFSQPIHFAGHFVAAYGYDDADVLLVDTQPQGTLQRAPRAAVEAARFARGPMAAKARSWTIDAPPAIRKLASAIRAAIRANARAYLAPAFSGASHLGIIKLAESLPSWRRLAKHPATDLALAALLMERAGTGGALFRNFYRDFLREAREHLPAPYGALEAGEASFAESATHWSKVASLLTRGTEDALREAAELCRRIASLEVEGMRTLARI